MDASNTTRAALLDAGMALAKRIGVGKITNKNVTAEAGVYHNAVRHHFGGISEFRELVMQQCVKKGLMQAQDSVPAIRKSPEARKAEILAEAVRQAKLNGISFVTRISVADALGVTDGLINRYFNGVRGLRQAILAKGVEDRSVDIVADAIELGMPEVKLVPADLHAEAVALFEPQ